VRSDRHCVYGIICEATHAELRSLYGQDWLGGTYLPEPVLVEIADGPLVPALCYIAPTRPPARPADDYLDWIIGPPRVRFPRLVYRAVGTFSQTAVGRVAPESLTHGAF